jgi:putative peptide zinc metalloprotease protein
VKSDIGTGENSHQLRIGSSSEYGRSQFYLVDSASKTVWDLIDGNRTVKEIVNKAAGLGIFKDKSDDVYGILLFFADVGALKAAEDPSVWKRVRVTSSFMTQIALIKDSTKILKMVHKITRPFLRKSVFWLTMLIAFIGVVVYAPRFNNIFNDRTSFQILGSTVVGFLFYNFLVLGPVIIIHEMAHGLALLHYTGKSGEVGTGWFYFGPTFYVDVTSYWSLARWKRIMIMWAGNLSTLFIGALLVLSQFIIPYSPSMLKLTDIAAFWCFYGTLWNLAPPFETDGYYILSDILKIPNLRHDGFSYLKTRILQLFRHDTRWIWRSHR